ncbi:nuclear transport factor 2 family protein [Luteipulveratus halotolerans]|uniref:Polyketide cyclase n=1 Tax=Luteipulveratus halotolerans TaxID=1631356 RepID=A0A0L6CM69_9MICO|nr:nuclear transport factor 2 family protein [Luteipulveratus halotolerans]KNX38623.1 polyketide cyclase [Luteipulveratus halotolerans]
MKDVTTAYLATWNEQDTDARTKLLAESWADNASYTDPLADAAGRDAISATIAAVHEQFPGMVFTLVGEPDHHHRQTRFQWGLGPEGAEPLVIGFDVVVTDDQGRIETVLGFLDRVPAGAA